MVAGCFVPGKNAHPFNLALQLIILDACIFRFVNAVFITTNELTSVVIAYASENVALLDRRSRAPALAQSKYHRIVKEHCTLGSCIEQGRHWQTMKPEQLDSSLILIVYRSIGPGRRISNASPTSTASIPC